MSVGVSVHVSDKDFISILVLDFLLHSLSQIVDNQTVDRNTDITIAESVG